MGPKAEWAIDSEAMRARGIIFFSKNQLVGQKYLACAADVERGGG